MCSHIRPFDVSIGPSPPMTVAPDAGKCRKEKFPTKPFLQTSIFYRYLWRFVNNGREPEFTVFFTSQLYWLPKVLSVSSRGVAGRPIHFERRKAVESSFTRPPQPRKHQICGQNLWQTLYIECHGT